MTTDEIDSLQTEAADQIIQASKQICKKYQLPMTGVVLKVINEWKNNEQVCFRYIQDNLRSK